MKNKFYKEVVIKSEDDLPKEDKLYTVHIIGSPEDKTDCFGIKHKDYLHSAWVSVDWYLLPVQEQSGQVTDGVIDLHASHYGEFTDGNKNGELAFAFREGAKWYKSQLKPVVQEQSAQGPTDKTDDEILFESKKYTENSVLPIRDSYSYMEGWKCCAKWFRDQLKPVALRQEKDK